MPWSVKDGSKRQGVPVRRRNWVSAYVISLFIFSVSERERRVLERNGTVGREISRRVACTPGIGLSDVHVPYVPREHCER